MNSADVVRLVTGLAWPVVTVALVLALRSSILALIKSVATSWAERGQAVSITGFGIDVKAALSSVISPAQVPSDVARAEFEVAGERLTHPGPVSPLSIVQAADARLERFLSASLGLDLDLSDAKSLFEMTAGATQKGLLAFEAGAMLRKLCFVRVSLKKQEMSLMSSDASEYAVAALAVENKLMEISDVRP